MADIKFACPHCAQHITCDELWGGHQLECPSCKNPLAVPAPVATPASPGTPAATSFTPKPPAAAEPRLAINAGHAAGPAAGAPQRTIPIRNLTAPPPKKKSPVAKFATVAAVLIVLGAGAYFGYPWLSGMQDKVNTASKEAAKSADGGEVSHIAKLNGVLDATDPNRAPADGRASGPRQRRSGVGQEIPLSGGNDGATASTNPADTEPLIPAVWTLDLTKARIPSGRANGAVSGTNFVPEAVSPEREVLVYLHLKPGEKLGGQTLNISQEMAGAGVPQVTKRWKTNPKYAPQFKSFTSGYAMRLELGQLADGALPGKIFLALPDADQSVVAGNFRATINTNVVVEATVQAAPVMAPTPSGASDAAWQARYGTKPAR
jgi:hypothetical protein